MHMPHYDARVLEDYDRMKDALTVDLVPVAGNEQKLAQIPHKNVEDMALVYRFEEESSVYGTASILVTNEMLAVYDITADQLHEDAMKAAVQNRPAKLHILPENFDSPRCAVTLLSCIRRLQALVSLSRNSPF